jgi:hypothetical protein
MKFALVLVTALGMAACGGKSNKPTTPSNANGSGSNGSSTGGTTYGGATAPATGGGGAASTAGMVDPCAVPAK